MDTRSHLGERLVVTPVQCGILLLLPIAQTSWSDFYQELRNSLGLLSRIRLTERNVKPELASIYLAAIRHALVDHSEITKEQEVDVFEVCFKHIIHRVHWAFGTISSMKKRHISYFNIADDRYKIANVANLAGGKLSYEFAKHINCRDNNAIVAAGEAFTSVYLGSMKLLEDLELRPIDEGDLSLQDTVTHLEPSIRDSNLQKEHLLKDLPALLPFLAVPQE